MTTQEEKRQQALRELTELETRAAALRAIIEEPEKPGRWEPGKGERYWYVDEFGDIEEDNWCGDNGKLDRRSLSIGNVHRTREDAETYKLWLESFVPVYGLKVPDARILNNGWIIATQLGEPAIMACTSPDDGELKTSDSSFARVLARFGAERNYLNGTWHPTKEAAAAWLERFGKVRGFVK